MRKGVCMYERARGCEIDRACMRELETLFYKARSFRWEIIKEWQRMNIFVCLADAQNHGNIWLLTALSSTRLSTVYVRMATGWRWTWSSSSMLSPASASPHPIPLSAMQQVPFCCSDNTPQPRLTPPQSPPSSLLSIYSLLVADSRVLSLSFLCFFLRCQLLGRAFSKTVASGWRPDCHFVTRLMTSQCLQWTTEMIILLSVQIIQNSSS